MPYANHHEEKLYAKLTRKLAGKHTPYKLIDFRNHPHWTLEKAKSLIPTDRYNTFFKFCFVRHPTDWQHSMFRHILAHEHLPEFKERYKKLYEHRDFHEYMKWRIDAGVIPQVVQMLNKKMKIDVDFVGRFENLNDDFDEISRRVGIECKLPFLNKGKNKKEIHISQETKRLIYHYYKIDFEVFGYDKEGYDKEWILNKDREIHELKSVYDKVGIDYDVWRKNEF